MRVHVAGVHVVIRGIPLHIDHHGLLANGCACDGSLRQPACCGVVDIEQLLPLLRWRDAAIRGLDMPEHEDLTAINGQTQCPIPRPGVQRGPEPRCAVGRQFQHAGLDVFRRVGRDIDPGFIHGDAKRRIVRAGPAGGPPVVAGRIVRAEAHEIGRLQARRLQESPGGVAGGQRVAVAIETVPDEAVLAGVLSRGVEQFADELPLGVIHRRRHPPGFFERVGHDLRRRCRVDEPEQYKKKVPATKNGQETVHWSRLSGMECVTPSLPRGAFMHERIRGLPLFPISADRGLTLGRVPRAGSGSPS